ncbi:PREDICTED: 23 kDa integral membrane protein-like [Rhagoletis zephyria]|uniref:23 kDa integral membrane protein-like n=1 Tax=Rhagoletis zephyria TaxID=28612 RepID=UPI0008118867|nr:PREDICTED: 23 kDa integral membrane protein-like [Rhagoletis zephyria]
MNCLESIVKYLIYIANIIFLVCGILIIVLGAFMINNIGDFSSIEDAIDVDTLPIIIIILGCIIFVISFFGCCGAIRENSCCMTTYAVFMFILFCLQVALVVWVFVQRSEFLKTMRDLVNTTWDKNDNSANGIHPMDALQISFKCCGKTSSADYTSAGKDVPVSCCGSLDATTCPASVYLTKPGCADAFVDFWATNTNIIRYAGIAVAAIELAVFTIACCLASSMRNSRRH